MIVTASIQVETSDNIIENHIVKTQKTWVFLVVFFFLRNKNGLEPYDA